VAVIVYLPVRAESGMRAARNHNPATRHDVGKTVKRTEPKKKPADRQVK